MWNPFSSHIMQQVSLYVAVPLFLSTYNFQREKSVIFKIFSILWAVSSQSRRFKLRECTKYYMATEVMKIQKIEIPAELWVFCKESLKFLGLLIQLF